jgi:peptidoglycan/LPS O-acetylase OafA/YrhL
VIGVVTRYCGLILPWKTPQGSTFDGSLYVALFFWHSLMGSSFRMTQSWHPFVHYWTVSKPSISGEEFFANALFASMQQKRSDVTPSL